MASKKTRLFMSGNSQAVRIPKEFHFNADEVAIRQRAGALVLRPKKQSWASLVNSLTKFTDDFMAEGRRQLPVQDRGRAL
jgi:antitoxin VapB